jgi:glucose-6-phosphate-specific signal transduction histidine kinase
MTLSGRRWTTAPRDGLSHAPDPAAKPQLTTRERVSERDTIKHAKASHSEVIVEQRDSRLWVCVRDDGVGGATTQRGSGLIGMHDSVEAIDGTVDLTSPAGQGTLTQVSLPL